MTTISEVSIKPGYIVCTDCVGARSLKTGGVEYECVRCAGGGSYPQHTYCDRSALLWTPVPTVVVTSEDVNPLLVIEQAKAIGAFKLGESETKYHIRQELGGVSITNFLVGAVTVVGMYDLHPQVAALRLVARTLDECDQCKSEPGLGLKDVCFELARKHASENGITPFALKIVRPKTSESFLSQLGK